MGLSNLSTLLKSDNDTQAVSEAQKNILKSMINSKAQDSGWGKMEVFLLKLCSLFSERCKNISTTLADIQCALNTFKDDHYVSGEQNLEESERCVLRLWLAKEIYRKLGADMYFQVNADPGNSTRAQLVLDGQPKTTESALSIWGAGELSCEIDISVEEGEILKALAGDVLPENLTSHPYVKSDDAIKFIQSETSSLLTGPQKKLVGILVKMPTNNLAPSMKLIGRANKALETVSAYINGNNTVGSDSDKNLTPAMFRDMYRKQTDYTMEDFLAVSSPVVNITEGIGRQNMVTLTRQHMNQRMGALVEREGSLNTALKEQIKQEIDNLKTVAFDFMKELCSASAPEHNKTIFFDEDDWENSLKPLPKTCQRKFKDFIEKYNECESSPSEGSFKAVVDSVKALLRSEEKARTAELESIQHAIDRQNKIANGIIKAIESAETKKIQYNCNHQKLTEKINSLKSLIDSEEKELQTAKECISQLSKKTDELKSEKEVKLSQVDLLRNNMSALQQNLSVCEKKLQKTEDDFCSEVERLAKAIFQEFDCAERAETVFNEQIDLSNRVIAKAKGKNFARNFVQTIAEDGKAETELGISVAEVREAFQNCSQAERDVINALREHFNQTYTILQFQVGMRENGILGSFGEILPEYAQSQFRGIISYINEENLKTFLKALDEKYTNKTAAAGNNNFDSKYDAIYEKLDSYIVARNSLNKLTANQDVILKLKQSYVDTLRKTVDSMAQIANEVNDSLNDLDKSKSKLDLDFSGLDSMPEKVRALIQSAKDEYQSAVAKLMSTSGDFKNRTERLLKIVLPKLVTPQGGYWFNSTNLGGVTPLDKQDIDDIEWCANYMEYNGVSEITEHQMKNSFTGYNAFLKEKERCENALKKLNSLVRELNVKFADEINEHKKQVNEFKESIKNNLLQEKKMSSDIDRIAGVIEKHNLDISEQQKKGDDLQGKIASHQKQMQDTETKISKCDKKITALNDRIESDKRTLSTTKNELSKLNEDIVNIDNRQKHTESNKLTSFIDRAELIRLEAAKQFDYLNKQKKELQDSRDFLSRSISSLNAFNDWEKTPVSKNNNKNIYDGIVFANIDIPINANGKEGIKIWDSYDYQTINLTKYPAKARNDKEVATDALTVDEGNKLLEENQNKSFNELFALKNDYTLISDVYNLLEIHAGTTETPDFKLLSKYIEYCYNAVKGYEKLQNQGNDATDLATIIAELKEKLYKAQVLFGIFMISPFIKSNNALSTDIINAGSDAFMLSQLNKNSHIDDNKFNSYLKKWQETEKDDEKKTDNNPSLDYAKEVLKQQMFYVASTIQTGRLISPNVTSEFVAPSIQQYIKTGGVHDQKGIQFLFSLTDVASGVVIPDVKNNYTSAFMGSYRHLSDERTKWIEANPDFNQQVELICDRLELSIKGINAPEVSSVVA
ncbi:hypothetical protein ONM75_004251 [Escherichia coli]|nr:hypothetical protein [Escherichia coli]